MAHVLLVDDNASFAKVTSELIEAFGFEVSHAETLAAARRALAMRSPDLLMVDLMLPDGSGLELIEDVGAGRGPEIVIITGNPTVDTAIRAVQAPVMDYLIKPFGSTELKRCLDRIGQPPRGRRNGKNARNGSNGKAEAGPELHFGYLVGESAPMRKLYDTIERIAPLDATVLIYGASGTGKELVAQAIHLASGRSGPFVPVNCGAIPESLISSELFGHERGSFTGAQKRHAGYFERAEGGTLFLDEVTELPAGLQAHFLRVLETGALTRVGGSKEVELDVRVVAATNRDPEAAVASGDFREDLYYRLMMFPIALTSLANRTADIPALAGYFLSQMNRKYAMAKTIDAKGFKRLEAHPWPGNVRELQHVVQRAFILSGDAITAEQLGHALDAGLGKSRGRLDFEVGLSIKDVERRLILSTLEHFNGDKTLAAETLGISLKTLYNRLEQYTGEVEDDARSPSASRRVPRKKAG
ncbi:MAG: sigma-54-dependent Fis family transcriptional regulator [Gammaproteobacteria bacterium]|nr:sigma-54-dependent Fis family transcriptional regulator [Gammaproteobacteria bacterium]